MKGLGKIMNNLRGIKTKEELDMIQQGGENFVCRSGRGNESNKAQNERT